MKIVIDVSLPPSWTEIFEKEGYEARHWADIGDRGAKDEEIFDWAGLNGFVIFTHDLDFGTLLALAKSKGPSVILARTANVDPVHLWKIILNAVHLYEKELDEGAILVVDEVNMRLRLLPIP